MSVPMPCIDFQKYLAAKKSVDDRALNRHVLASLAKETDGGRGQPLQVLDVGAGIGSMLERLAAWHILKNVRYDAIDIDAHNIREARRLIPLWSASLGLELADGPAGFTLARENGAVEITAHFETADLYEFAARRGRRPCDLVIAHAFMDLVDADRALQALLSVLTPGGLLYLTANFDGLTVLEPPAASMPDRQVLALYHESMDSRLVGGLPSGDSRTGRRLFSLLRRYGVELLDAGSSDWVVYPAGGRYPQDEAYFLHAIVTLIETALKNSPALSPADFSRWIDERRSQIESGELVLIAHQMDFLGRAKPRPGQEWKRP